MSDAERGDSSQVDRRANLVLRALIDDMLGRLRELNRSAPTMSAEERARAEADLEHIMARVRRAAARVEEVE